MTRIGGQALRWITLRQNLLVETEKTGRMFWI
jgi:hypothetical protein